MHQSLAFQLDRLAHDRWARRGVRILLRTLWLSLAVWCIGLGGHLLFDWPLRLDLLGALSLALLGLGTLLLLRRRMPATEVARRLDRRFRLNEQLATALELGESPPATETVAGYLHNQSRRTIGQIRRHIARRQRFPWPEIGVLFALALIVLGLLVMAGITPAALLSSRANPLPELAGPRDPAAAQFPPEPFAGPPPGLPTPGDQPGAGTIDQSAAAAIADALRDQSVTRPAAEALDQGDVAGAAQSLRELADQAGQISEPAREGLADELRDAARDLQGSSPEIAGQLRDAAEGLEQGGQQAAEGLDTLAGAIEGLGQSAGQNAQGPAAEGAAEGEGSGQNQASGQSGGSGTGALPGEQREQPQASERLGVDGVPLELDSRGEGSTPVESRPDQVAPSAGAGQGGFEQSSRRPSGDRIYAGDDPLRIPVEDRNVVQKYFSP